MKYIKIGDKIFPSEGVCDTQRLLLFIGCALPDEFFGHTHSAESTSVNNGAVYAPPCDKPVVKNSHFAVRGGGASVRVKDGYTVKYLLSAEKIQVCLFNGRDLLCVEDVVKVDGPTQPVFYGIEPIEIDEVGCSLDLEINQMIKNKNW